MIMLTKVMIQLCQFLPWSIKNQSMYVSSSQVNYQVTFCWIPSHKLHISSACQLEFFSAVWQRSGRTRRLFRFYFMKEMKGWQSEAGGLMEGHSLADDPARAALAGIITHSLPATLPHSFTLCLLSFLPHSPFILDLLSWWRQRWWWVSLHDTELGVRNTIQNWDRFSTLHRSLQRITPFVKSAVLRAHFAPQVCLVPLFGATWAPTSAQWAWLPRKNDTHKHTHASRNGPFKCFEIIAVSVAFSFI